MNDEYRTEVIRTAAAQHDAAEGEMDLYRAEITRITAARDEYRDNAVLHVRERDEARGQLADAVAKSDRLEGQNGDLRAELAALREHLDGLATAMHAEAQMIAPASSQPDGMPDITDQVRAQVLHEYASRIRQAIQRAGVPS